MRPANAFVTMVAALAMGCQGEGAAPAGVGATEAPLEGGPFCGAAAVPEMRIWNPTVKIPRPATSDSALIVYPAPDDPEHHWAFGVDVGALRIDFWFLLPSPPPPAFWQDAMEKYATVHFGPIGHKPVQSISAKPGAGEPDPTFAARLFEMATIVLGAYAAAEQVECAPPPIY